jgi:hypothetical protein
VTRATTPTLNFSTTLNRATISPSRITLHSAAGTQQVALSVSGNQLKLVPNSTLLPSARYTIDVAGIRGVGGEQLAAPISLQFTTRDGAWQTPKLLQHFGDASEPQLAMNANGVAFAVWTQHFGNTPLSVWAARYLPNIGWSEPVPLEAEDAFGSSSPVIAVDRSGHALALWARYDGARGSIYAAYYVPGSGWGSAQLISTGASSDSRMPQVAFDAAGNALAVWSQSDPGIRHIWADRYVAGSGWSGAVVIDGAGETTPQNTSFPEIAVDAQGNAFAVWDVLRDRTRVVLVNRYVVNAGWGNPQLLDPSLTVDASAPDVQVDGHGNAMATWFQPAGI